MKTIVAALTSWGPLGLFVLAILDSAGIPLPAAVDALLVASGAVNPAAAYLSAAMAVLGSTIGSAILFYLGRKGGQAYLDRVTQSGRGATFRRWFQTYGLITVFIPALLPIPLPLKVFVVSAGALGVRWPAYLGTILAARIPRYFGLAWLGAQLGEHTMGWLQGHVWNLLAFAAVLTAILMLAARQAARSKASAEQN